MFNPKFTGMKNVIVSTMLLVVMVVSAAAQSCSVPPPVDKKATLGKWQGNYTQNGEIKTLQVEFQEADEQIVPYVDMPGHRMKNTRFEFKFCGQKEVHLKKVNVDNTTFEFVGVPQGDKITGRLTIRQGDKRLGDEIFTLTRASQTITAVN